MSLRQKGDRRWVRGLIRHALFACGLLIGMGAVSAALGQQKVHRVGEKTVAYEQINPNWKDCGLRPLDENAFFSRRMSVQKDLAKTATIEVDYGAGFTAEAQEAFERAVAVWETHIASDVTIRIDASFEDLGENVLGGAGPNRIYAVDTSGDGELDVFYGDALIDALQGEDQNTGTQDIVARFSSTRDDWHFGEGNAPANTIDFTSVVLHEIGHGLHYVGAASVDSDGTGRYGDIDFNGDGEPDGIPSAFTARIARQEADDSLTPLTDESTFPNPSTALGQVLTGGALVYDGEQANTAAAQSTGPVPPKIYAPSDFSRGSSIFHLDEDTYPFGGDNALMTPRINRAETNRLPGPIVCGQLLDMGWTPGQGCALGEAFIENVTASVGESGRLNEENVELSWELAGAASIDRFVVEQIFFGTTQKEIEVAADGAGTYSTTLSGLRVGEYSFRVSYVTSDGRTVPSGEVPTVTVEADAPEVSAYPNPFDERVNVSFILPDEQDVTVEVFDALGRQVAEGRRTVAPNDSRPVTFTGAELGPRSSGIYFIRVEGEDFEKTVQVARVQ